MTNLNELINTNKLKKQLEQFSEFSGLPASIHGADGNILVKAEGNTFADMLPSVFKNAEAENIIKGVLKTENGGIFAINSIEIDNFPTIFSAVYSDRDMPLKKLKSAAAYVSTLTEGCLAGNLVSAAHSDLYCDNVRMLRTFYATVEQSPISIVVTDKNGTIEYVNPFFKELTGFSREEIIGLGFSGLKSGEHDREFYKNLWQTIRNGKIWTGKFINKKKDGSKYIELAKIAPIIESGEITRFIGIKTDITEQERLQELLEESNLMLEATVRKRTEKLRSAYIRLKENRDLLNKTQKVARMGGWMRDMRTRKGFWTDEAFAIFGMERGPEAPTVKEILTATHPEDRDKVREWLESLFRYSPEREFSFRIIRPDGEERIITSIYSYDFDASGKPYRINGIHHDQTERIRTAERIEKHEKLLSSILLSANAGICVLDGDCRIEMVNPEFEKIFGHKNLTAGSLFVDACPEILNSRDAGILSDALRTKTPMTRMEYSFSLPSGKEKILIMNVTVPRADHDPVTLITVSDITELSELHNKQKEQEAMLIQQSKMAALGEMIGVITHQWQQPLNAVGMFSQLIETEFKSSELNAENLREYISAIMGQLEFMSQTVKDFRNFFKPGQADDRFEVSAALEEIISLVAVHYANSRIEILPDLHCTDKPLVYGSRNEFKQVILNLLANAKDAITDKLKGAAGGVIRVSCTETGDEVIIRIRDNGGGIPEGVKDSIFKSYFTTKGSSGTGIGLYISKLIAETHMKGSITAENEEGGAVFTLRLKKPFQDL
ncbi:PAS domain S-box protein [Geovibrio thiophilus]|uniref:histidine kinase n=1 Tax=Geovibrio thiophilus TaxID=139438 RepID=A0A3R5XY79_9BACT|nr:PAS domain S-box protein [Geovibrio thiophilus]QAR34154.1 PAS domain S-box protein [Geovibrio thiophilus]